MHNSVVLAVVLLVIAGGSELLAWLAGGHSDRKFHSVCISLLVIAGIVVARSYGFVLDDMVTLLFSALALAILVFGVTGVIKTKKSQLPVPTDAHLN